MTLRTGDIVTFSGRPSRWRRLLIWLRLSKPRPLKMFVVTWTTAKGWDE